MELILHSETDSLGVESDQHIRISNISSENGRPKSNSDPETAPLIVRERGWSATRAANSCPSSAIRIILGKRSVYPRFIQDPQPSSQLGVFLHQSVGSYFSSENCSVVSTLKKVVSTFGCKLENNLVRPLQRCLASGVAYKTVFNSLVDIITSLVIRIGHAVRIYQQRHTPRMGIVPRLPDFYQV